MARTDNLRRQHEKLLAKAGEIDALASRAASPAVAQEIRNHLSQLIGTLMVHLAAEDQSLYPELLKSADKETREVARRFSAEMGGVGNAVAEFNRKFTASQIGSSASFAQEWKSLLKVLADRIARENTELYPLADAMSA